MIIKQIHKTNEDYEFYLKKYIELHHSRAVKAIHKSGGVSNAVDFFAHYAKLAQPSIKVGWPTSLLGIKLTTFIGLF